jgi:hypothetical protein
MMGGSSHRSQRNSEGAKERNNREFVDDLLDDYAKGENTDGVYVGRIVKRMGQGRMEVFYMKPAMGGRLEPTQAIMPLRGGLRGKGKKSVWVDTDSLVMIAETGLAGTTHEIVAVFTEKHVAIYKSVMPNADPRLFLKTRVADDTAEDGMFEREEEAEVDVDAI